MRWLDLNWAHSLEIVSIDNFQVVRRTAPYAGVVANSTYVSIVNSIKYLRLTALLRIRFPIANIFSMY